MRTFIFSILVVLAAGCAAPRQESIKLPPTIPLPPLPAPEAVMKRQSVRAFAASSASSEVVTSSSDTNSPNYGIVGTFPVEYEGGGQKATTGVYVQWNNWPAGTPYVIQKTTNLVDWTEVVLSAGDEGRVLVIFDTERQEFYRLVRAFVSTPQ